MDWKSLVMRKLSAVAEAKRNVEQQHIALMNQEHILQEVLKEAEAVYKSEVAEARADPEAEAVEESEAVTAAYPFPRLCGEERDE